MTIEGIPPLDMLLLKQLRQPMIATRNAGTTLGQAAQSAPSAQARPAPNVLAPTMDPSFLSPEMIGILVRLQIRTTRAQRREKTATDDTPEKEEDTEDDAPKRDPDDTRQLTTLSQQQAAFYRRQFD